MNALCKTEWNPRTECLTEVFRLRENISLFGGFIDAQLERIAEGAAIEWFDSGTPLFQQGGLPSEIYIVLRGRVSETVKRDDDSVLRTEYKEGDCFGEGAVVGIMPHAGEAIAAVNSKVLRISRFTLMDIAEKDPSLFSLFMMNIARDVSRRLRCVLLAGNHEIP